MAKTITRTLKVTSADVTCYNRQTKEEETVKVITTEKGATADMLMQIADDENENLVPLDVINMVDETHTYSLDILKFIELSDVIDKEVKEND